MEDSGSLPGRSDVGDKIFSPLVDRISLISLIVIGVMISPLLSSELEPVLGGKAFTTVVCGLVIVIPLIASSIGKLYVRIRA